jgi:hypothetical protein
LVVMVIADDSRSAAVTKGVGGDLLRAVAWVCGCSTEGNYVVAAAPKKGRRPEESNPRGRRLGRVRQPLGVAQRKKN